jgi:hypothetical protein
MTKSNGIKSLKQAAKLLNKHAPDGESLAYINPEEGRLLKAHGGSGIMTVAGVPTYGAIWDFAKGFIPETWHAPLESAGRMIKGINPYSQPDKPVYDDKGRQTNKPRSIVNDALSVWGALRAKKDKEGLNAAEMEQFNKLNQQLTAAKTEFDVNTDFGTPLKTPENVPTTIEDVSTFTDVTLPTMKTTAVAEGGRIGYRYGTRRNGNGDHPLHDDYWEDFDPDRDQDEAKNQMQGIKGQMAGGEYNRVMELMLKIKENIPLTENEQVELRELMKTLNMAQGGRIGYNMGGIDTPFQGIGALNPRMGYAQGMGPHWDVPTFSEGVEQMYESGPLGVKDFETINWERESPYGEIAALLKGTGVQESETTDYNTVPYPVIREKMKSYADMGGSDNIYDIIKIATQVGDKEFVDYLRKTFTAEGNQWIEDPGMEWKESKQWGALGAAHGGRIGAQSGGIMPLLDMGGMEKDYRQDGGFVPIGRKEKADDVPARLSKNEFVFTADAVRAAGGGDIDQGAQRMYNVMKNLEAGGEISKQSQGQG